MTNFQEQLAKELKRVESNSGGDFGEVEYPTNALKHDQLYFSKDTPQHIVRILPGAGGKFFSKEFREIYLSTRNKNNKGLKLSVYIGSEDTPENSKFLANLLQWQQDGRVPNNWDNTAKPTNRYFVNAVNVTIQNGQPVMETDANGNLVVRLLKLPTSAYNSIIKRLGDPMLSPDGADEYGFIGEKNAYPIRITKPSPGQMSYEVDIFQKDLGPLPNGWENELEDLEYQATPTEEFNGEFLDYFIDVVNGVEGQGNSNQGNNSQGGGQQQATPQQNWTPNQNQGNNQNQFQNQGNNQNQGNDGWGQPATQQQNQGQANTQQSSDDGWGQPATQQQNQGAPQQNTQSVPTQNNQGAPQQNTQQTPNQQQTQAPQQNNQGAPQQDAGAPKSIQSVLDQMKQGVNE